MVSVGADPAAMTPASDWNLTDTPSAAVVATAATARANTRSRASNANTTLPGMPTSVSAPNSTKTGAPDAGITFWMMGPVGKNEVCRLG